MRRREFLIASAASVGLSARGLFADHHFASAFPLVVEFDLASLQGQYTPSADFYIRNHFAAPNALAAPELIVKGEVERPLRLRAAELSRLPEQQIGAVLECAGDPLKSVSLVSDGVWRGHLLRDILSLAKPKPSARYAHLTGLDGFARSVPVEWLLDGGLLATSLNAAPLGRNHGAPWRALFPGWYGFNSVKWVKNIRLASAPLPPQGSTYIEVWRGASGAIERKPLPPVQVKSVITTPADGAVLNAGQVQTRGLAWSGAGPITGVQVSANGGNHWMPSALNAAPSRYDWVRWTATFTLQPGVVEIVCKATDSAANTQPPRRDPGRVDYYAYNVWDRIRCVVV